MDIRGQVTRISPAVTTSGDNKIIGSILIEGAIEQDTRIDKASVKITNETRLLEQIGETRRPTTFQSIKFGDHVQAKFTGPVAESYPVQATASEIVILR